MIRRLLAAAAGTFLIACARDASPQPRPATPAVIGAHEVRRHVEALASDACEGRGAGYPGEERAAAYVASRFEEIGLRPADDSSPSGPSFEQRFPFPPRAPEVPGQILTSRNVVGLLEGDDAARREWEEILAARTRYARAVVLDLANREEAPRFRSGRGNDLGMIPVVASASELRVLGLPAGSRALKISAVIPGLRADRAGLKPGDVVFKMNGRAFPKDADGGSLQQAADASPRGVLVSVARQGRRDLVPLPRGGA